MAQEFHITADSTPDYDNWGPDDYWGQSHWLEWHRKMKAKYGRDYANHTFVEAWHKDKWTKHFGSAHFDFTLNSSFNDYAKKEGFYKALFTGVEGLATKIISSGANAVSKATDVADTAVSGAENLVKGVGNTTKVLKWILPALILIVIGYVLYQYRGALKLARR